MYKGKGLLAENFNRHKKINMLMEQLYEFIKSRRPLTHFCKAFLWPLVIVLLPQYISASNLILQTSATSISGNVTDESGSPLPGVNIIEKGTTNGTVSDSEGNYILLVASSQSTLVFSFVGTVTQEVTIGNQAVINIQLVADAATLSEVVVVGYGTREKKDITGSVSSVKSEDFNRGIINSPEQLLQGKVSGVNVTSASGEPGGGGSL